MMFNTKKTLNHKSMARNLLIGGIIAMATTSFTPAALAFAPETHLVPQYLAQGHKLATSVQDTKLHHAARKIPHVRDFHNLDGLSPTLMQKALHGYRFAQQHYKVTKPYLVVVNYSIPSDKPRLWIFDLRHHQLLAHLRVAHGANSGTNVATRFSNRVNTHMSCLGVFVTGKTYNGEFGYSMHLRGLQAGINDNAYKRHIVMHPGSYVGDKAVRDHGEAGKTWGCLAMDPHYVKQVINLIKNGSVIQSFA